MSTAPARHLRRRIRIAIAVLAAVCVVGAAGGLYLASALDDRHRDRAERAAQAVIAAESLHAALAERSAGSRGYLLTGDRALLEARDAATDAVRAALAAVGEDAAAHARRIDAVLARLDRRTVDAAAAADPGAYWSEHIRPVDAELGVEVAGLVEGAKVRWDVARAGSAEAALHGRIALATLVVSCLVAIALLMILLGRTASELQQVALADQERTFLQIFEQVPVGIFVVDRTGQTAYVNQAANHMLGRPTAVGGDGAPASYRAYVAGTAELYPDERAPIARALHGESTEVNDMELHRDGDVVPLHVRGGPVYGADGELIYAVAAFQDVRELHRHAMRDAVTGLANRASLRQTFKRDAAVAARSGRPVAVAIIDLDHFKAVNDVHGHAIGDRVLEASAAAIAGALRRADVVGRWGGEEFVAMFPDTDAAGARRALEKALDAVRGTTFLGADRTPFTVTFSAGVAVAQPGESLDDVVARADQALYQVKRSGRGRVRAAGHRVTGIITSQGGGSAGVVSELPTLRPHTPRAQ